VQKVADLFLLPGPHCQLKHAWEVTEALLDSLGVEDLVAQLVPGGRQLIDLGLQPVLVTTSRRPPRDRSGAQHEGLLARGRSALHECGRGQRVTCASPMRRAFPHLAWKTVIDT
jgi:hypothetical protein